jgi:hypothetical protein
MRGVKLRFLPSLADLAFTMPLVFVFASMGGARALLADGDTGWHVRTGEWILAHRAVPRVDLFSYTRAGEPWFAWEWGWDVLAAWLHGRAGMAAVVAFSLLLVAVVSALLFRLVWRRSGSVLVAVPVALLAMAAGSVHWLARPHLVTLLLVAVFLAVLERAAEGRTGLLWVLPPLTAVWANLHGGFVAGLVLVAVYGLRRRPWPWVACAAASAAASLLNPYGWQLHLHIARYLVEPYQYVHIAEFRPVAFASPAARYLEVLCALGAAAGLWSAWKRRWTDAVLIAFWGHLALVAARNIPLFAVVAAPAVGQAVAEWLDAARAGWRDWSSGFDALESVPRTPLWSAVAVAAVSAAMFLPEPGLRFRAEYDSTRFPVAAAVVAGAPAGRIFTPDDWGGYLIYRLWPRTRVFVDGRSDFYGAAFGERCLDVLRVRPGWQEQLARYGVDTVLLPAGVPLAGVLRESPRWRAVYDDGVAIVFRARGPVVTQQGSGGELAASTRSKQS